MKTAILNLLQLHFRVLLRTTNGSVKEEIWQNKSFEEEDLVKMGDIGNFQSLLDNTKSSEEQDDINSDLPVTIAKTAAKDELF